MNDIDSDPFTSDGGEDSDDDRKPPALPDIEVNESEDSEEEEDSEEDDDDDDGNDPAAEANANSAQPSPYGFLISDVRKKKSSGALLCMAVGCEKNAQANTRIDNDVGGFCRTHYNAWLISTGQIESWTCTCGNKIATTSARCGKCHRWREGAKTQSSPNKKKKAAAPSPKTSRSPKNSPKKRDYDAINNDTIITQVPANSGVQIATIRKTNEKGRPLCKVVGCNKLDQSKSDGFCRSHYNMFSVYAGNSNVLSDWTCACGNNISGKQKRCGKCNKWRGGKRDPYVTSSQKEKKRAKKKTKKKTSRVTTEQQSTSAHHWLCNCGNEVPNAKSRCGKCHHWRGGKRKGGWKIKDSINKKDIDDTGINWSMDWSCCGEVVPSKKTRCGKCHGWRGGKRVAKSLRMGASSNQNSRGGASSHQPSSHPSHQLSSLGQRVPLPDNNLPLLSNVAALPNIPTIPAMDASAFMQQGYARARQDGNYGVLHPHNGGRMDGNYGGHHNGGRPDGNYGGHNNDHGHTNITFI